MIKRITLFSLILGFLLIPVLTLADSGLADRLKGYILLQVEDNGEAWYVNDDGKRYYMKDGGIAYDMMRNFGLGITDSDLGQIPVADDADDARSAVSVCHLYPLAERLNGKILLQVEQHGEAWYVNPKNCYRVYMADGPAAYDIMRFLSLGISNNDLSKISRSDGEVIEMVVYSDMQCPYCSRHHETVLELLEEYSGQIDYTFKHFPLSFHDYSMEAALAVECANEQGAMDEYITETFENQSELDSFFLLDLADDLDLDMDQFTTCLESEEYRDKVEADFDEGTEKGVHGTPATFINGELLSGAQPYDTFEELIEGILN